MALASVARAAGELDPTFDGDGKVVTDFGAREDVRGVAIQADGKIVAAGSTGADPQSFALARYNHDGSLDPRFGGDGRVVTRFAAAAGAVSVAIQADGRIVAAGSSFVGPNGENFALARYNADGSLDPSFDGDGKVVTDFGATDRANGVAIQADGRIVAAGLTFATVGAGNPLDFALARYNPNGSLDASFDGDGKVTTDFSGTEVARSVTIQPDGKIVAAGVGDNVGLGRLADFVLARYNPDGSLDPSFDGDGRVLTDFTTRPSPEPLGAADWANGVAIQADGKIVAAGRTFGISTPDDFALARYKPDGSLDGSFDGDGKVVTDFGGYDEGAGVAIQADGRVVVAGVSSTGPNPLNFALARYRPGGGLDPSFDGDGKVVTDFGQGDAGFGVAIQADRSIVAAGSSFTGANPSNFALARYLPDGLNRPPGCATVLAAPNTLRPPNRRLRTIALSGAADPDGDTVTLTITAVTQDEPLNGLGDGDRSPDARPGTRSNEVLLRAERSGTGDGRVYRLSFAASDGQGGTCSGRVTVGVPRNRGAASTPIDSAPPSFDSFG